MASLKILSGSLSGQEIDLDLDTNNIGRASNNEIKIADAGVSSKHAKIWAEEGRWWVMDLGSTNGTLVNNADIDREELKDGDKLSFGPILAQFVQAAKRRPGPTTGRAQVEAAAPPVMAPAPGRVAAPAMPIGFPGLEGGGGQREQELEIELSTVKARFATLEKDQDRMRSEFAEREKYVSEQATKGMKEEMQKLRDLMRERDQSMKTIESQIKERESYYSPEELEREKKRVEASVMLDAKRQAEAFERQVRELESRVVSRGAEAEQLARTVREKDDLIRMLSEREDRVGGTVKEKEDKLGELSAAIRKLEDEVSATGAREREANEKLKQKNAQLADMGKQQADLTQELARARAAAARVAGGDAGAGAEQQAQLAAELDQNKQLVLKLRAQLNAGQDEVIGAKSTAEQALAKAAQAQKQLDEAYGQLTDLTDEKSKLSSQVNDLLAKHSQMAEMERQAAGVLAQLEQLRTHDADLRAKVAASDSEVAKYKQDRLDLIAAKEEAEAKLGELSADYKILRASRDATFDWEARYKSQVDEFESIRRQNNEFKQTVEALQSQVGSAASGTVDDATLAYAKSRTTMLEQMAGGMLDGINNAVSLLRRNSEVLKGYVHDCGLLANCVRQINYTLLEPDQQRMLRELIDETQPDVIIRNMESIGEENADATSKAKRLILDYMEAMKVDEEGTDLERCFARSQGLVKAIDSDSKVAPKFSGATPPLPCTQPEGVLFAFALMREAKALAVDEDSTPGLRIDVQGTTITMMISPVHPKAKERYRETMQGGGDARSQYIVGFAKHAGTGRVDVKDMANASTLFVTLNGMK
jgi:pSer/pThr/pTyr-binding forkhead associated (FHA) protein